MLWGKICVDQSAGNWFVPHEFLDGLQTITFHSQIRSEGVSHVMRYWGNPASLAYFLNFREINVRFLKRNTFSRPRSLHRSRIERAVILTGCGCWQITQILTHRELVEWPEHSCNSESFRDVPQNSWSLESFCPIFDLIEFNALFWVKPSMRCRNSDVVVFQPAWNCFWPQGFNDWS